MKWGSRNFERTLISLFNWYMSFVFHAKCSSDGFTNLAFTSPIFFHQICCLYWSPQNRFLFVNQNIYKCQKSKSKKTIHYSWFVLKRFLKPSHEHFKNIDHFKDLTYRAPGVCIAFRLVNRISIVDKGVVHLSKASVTAA